MELKAYAVMSLAEAARNLGFGIRSMELKVTTSPDAPTFIDIVGIRSMELKVLVAFPPCTVIVVLAESVQWN